MKKITFFLTAMMLLVGATFAQQSRAISYGNKLSKDQNSDQVLQVVYGEKSVQSGTRAPGDIVFSEGFETATVPALPTGWTVSHTGTADSWISVGPDLIYGTGTDLGNIPGVTGSVPIYAGTRMLGLSWNETGRNAWAFSPGFTLTAGINYVVSFWLVMPGYPSYGEISGLECKIGQTPTGTGMSSAASMYYSTDVMITNWTKFSALFTPTTTGTYYLGFHDLTAMQEGIYTIIDEIEVVEASEVNDLQIMAENPLLPYTKIPASQAAGVALSGTMPFPQKLTALAYNAGTLTQTNVTFSATFDGLALGSSDPISLAPFATSEALNITTPPTHYPYLENDYDFIYAVSQNETDDNPEDNDVTFTLEIGNKYQLDAITTDEFGVGSNSGTLACGNIFPIYNATTLTDVELRFSDNPAMAGTAISISLYPMTSATQTGAAIFTQTATRPASGVITVAVPETALTAQNYYLCANQTTTTNFGICYDRRASSQRCYIRSVGAAAAALTMQSGFGAVAVRMITSGGTTPNVVFVDTDVTPTGTGTVTGGGVFNSGDQVTLTANAAFGYKFVEWSDGETANPYIFNATEDLILTAIFEEINTCQDIVVGTGTNTTYNYPINTFYNYSYTQQIYPAAEIGLFGNINSIALEFLLASNNYTDITIYMGTTDKTTFTNAQDLVPFADLQQVYQGPVNFSNATKWTQIDLDTPFPYTCGNLVVAILNNQGAYIGSTPSFMVTTPTPAGNYTACYYQDGSAINPANPTATNSNVQTARANMKFEVCPPQGCKDVQIGEGTTAVIATPFHLWYNNAYSQEIFLASEIGFPNGGVINSLSFQHTFPSNTSNVSIYIGHTTKSSFGGTTSSEWIPGANLTLVYAGALVMPTGWVTVSFNEPFEYDGVSNLVVAFVRQDSYTGGMTDNRFVAHSTGTDNRVFYWYADATFPGVNAPPTSSLNRATNRNNIIFNLCGDMDPVDMEASSITGPAMAVALDEYQYTVTVKNSGAFDVNNYTVNILNAAGDILGTATVTDPIAPDAIAQIAIPVIFTPAMVGTVNIRGSVEAGCDANLANNETAPMAVTVLSECTDLEKQETITIGNGTTGVSQYPVNHFYRNSYVQEIFLASEIDLPVGASIASLSFQHTLSGNPVKTNQTIYLGNTDKSNFTGTSGATADWVPAAQLQQVWSGSITFIQGWITIDFNTSFEYTGGNLVVTFLNTDGNYSNSDSRYYSHSTGTDYRTMHIYNDNTGTTVPSITNPGTSNWARAQARNNIIFSTIGIKEFTLNPADNYNGAEVTLVPDPLICGQTGIVYIYPENDCMAITDVKIDGVSQGPVSYIEFPNQNVPLPVIEVITFVPTFMINATAGDNGIITPAGLVTEIECGSDLTFDFIPDFGYTVDYFEVDDEVLPKKGNYTFEHIIDNHNIHVEFKEADYFIYFTHTGEGEVIPVGREAESVLGVIGVSEGDMQQFKFVPAPNYKIQAVYIDGPLNSSALNMGSYLFGNIQADHNIHVIFKPVDLTIVATAGPNGAINPAGNVLVPYGSDKTFTIIPSGGYVIDQVFIDGEPSTDYTDNTYTFEEVVVDHTIYVTFKVATVIVTVIVPEEHSCDGSMVLPGGVVELPYNADPVFTFFPAEGCKVTHVFVDGELYTPPGEENFYHFNYLTGDHTLEVWFDKKTYPVEAKITANGLINDAGITYVPHGDSKKYTFSAIAGHKVANVFIDGNDDQNAAAAGTYTFTNIREPHTIDVIIEPIVYNITASAAEGGYITPAGIIPVTFGGSQRFNFAANTGFEIESVTIDGIVNMQAMLSGSHIFTNVSADHTIEVVFNKLRFKMEGKTSGNGSIEPAGITEILFGEDITYSITPEEGYQISIVLVNGDNMGTIDTYTFAAVDADGTIEAFFTPMDPTGITNPTIDGVSVFSYTHIVYIVNKALVPVNDVSIFDMYGRIVWQGQASGEITQIPLQVADGIYTVRLTSDDQFAATKISIHR
ncbi:MAG: T9SS type A sorting domain-containing protein [Lentimicrobiaceae bacterium]|nr:T9SS type A sorting domain-containing protein [Lentimicrobiaceae bacterium]